MKRLLALFGCFAVVSSAYAAQSTDFTKTNLPYSDVLLQSAYALPISILTSEGVLKGNPDGMFRSERTLNRAEFLKIVISLRHPVFKPPVQPCFPDVAADAWYADYICFAKSWNIVSGYPDGMFRPEEHVNYVEALKMLSEVFGYKLIRQRGDEWFTPYLRTAKEQRTALPPTTDLAAPLTRGEMAELAAKYLVESRFELEMYEAVESGEFIVEARKKEASEEADDAKESEENTLGPSDSSESSASSTPLLPNQRHIPPSPLPSLNATSNFLVLGERNPLVGTIKVNPRDEPVEVREVKVTLSAAVSSIAAFEISDDLGFVLGTATLDIAASAGRDVYTLDLSPASAYFIGKNDQIVLTARARTNKYNQGGESGQTVEIASMTVTATGRWTSRHNLVTTTGPDFQSHQTSLATITGIKRNGDALSVFSTGTEKKIGAFDFASRSISDAASNPALQSLTFSISNPSAVVLSNAIIRGNDADLSHSCTIVAGTISCTSIPASIGNLQSPRTISMYADVTISGDNANPFLMIELNRPGRPDAAGDITWTDGITSFSWVPFDQPVAQGTSWQ
jgi:hypothetical protein